MNTLSPNTNPLGSNTVNFAVNMLDEERAILGRAAFDSGSRSIGDFVREQYLDALRKNFPDVAAKIEALRMAHRAVKMGIASTALLLLFLAAICLSHQDMRRARIGRTVRIVRNAKDIEV